MTLSINGRLVGTGHPAFIIAEACDNHMGDVDVALEMARQAKLAKADAVKYQHHLPDEEMLPDTPMSDNFSEPLYDFLKKHALTLDQHRRIKRYCDEIGITYLCTPFSWAAARELDSLGVAAYKIGSGEMTDVPSVVRIAGLGKPMIVSTGMATMEEIQRTYDALMPVGAPLALLNCVSEYPPVYEDVNLRVITAMQQRFPKAVIGHSDHTPDLFTSFSAITLGACIIEKHVILDKRTPGPDQSVSIDFHDLAQLVDGIRKIEAALGSEKAVHGREGQIRTWAFRSIVSTRQIRSGEVMTSDMLWTKRPGTGIPSHLLPEILGRKATRDIPNNKLIEWSDIEGPVPFMKKKRRLLFVTGSRGEWGYIRPILRMIEQSDSLSYAICATNTHLLPTYGYSLQEILDDGFDVAYKIYMSLDGYNHFSQAKSLGMFLASMADILASDTPDWIVLAGDRGEQLMGAVAGAFCYVPVAHIQAGELSGNIDGMTRHAIGKYAHLHLASNDDAADRLIRLGEEPFRVHNVGAPQVDELVHGSITGADELMRRYAIPLDGPFILVVQHPVTEEFEQAADQIDKTMAALREFDLPKIVMLPNNDAGSLMIRDGIDRHRHGEFHVFANFKREDYLGLMKIASCMLGNSSSGLIEAPSFELPVVNLGRRQDKRVQGRNVINAPFEEEAIVAALRQALSPEFRRSLRGNCPNPYGDGKAAERIVALLERTEITDKILVKNLTY